jgi:hypothetical protein
VHPRATPDGSKSDGDVETTAAAPYLPGWSGQLVTCSPPITTGVPRAAQRRASSYPSFTCALKLEMATRSNPTNRASAKSRMSATAM